MSHMYRWLFIVFSVVEFQAQSQIVPRFKIGFNTATISSSDLYSPNLLFGIQGGFTLNIPTNETTTWETGLSITQKGYGEHYIESGVRSRIKTKPIYVTMPILARVSFPLNGNEKIFIKGGVYFGAGIGGKIIGKFDLAVTSLFVSVLTGAKINPPSDYDKPINWEMFGDFNRFDYGFIAGVGLERNNLEYSLNLERGLMDIFPNNNAKNVVFSFLIGIKLK